MNKADYSCLQDNPSSIGRADWSLGIGAFASRCESLDCAGSFRFRRTGDQDRRPPGCFLHPHNWICDLEFCLPHRATRVHVPEEEGAIALDEIYLECCGRNGIPGYAHHFYSLIRKYIVYLWLISWMAKGILEWNKYFENAISRFTINAKRAWDWVCFCTYAFDEAPSEYLKNESGYKRLL